MIAKVERLSYFFHYFIFHLMPSAEEEIKIFSAFPWLFSSSCFFFLFTRDSDSRSKNKNRMVFIGKRMNENYFFYGFGEWGMIGGSLAKEKLIRRS